MAITCIISIHYDLDLVPVSTTQSKHVLKGNEIANMKTLICSNCTAILLTNAVLWI